MTQMKVTRLGYACGAEITGIDLKRTIDDATLDRIHSAWLEHQVLCFRDQELTKDEFVAFARQFSANGRFGEIDNQLHSPSRDPENPSLTVNTNKPRDGKPYRGYKEGTYWHSDRSVSVKPTTASLLLAIEIPEVGGDTMFANQYTAYEALSPAMRAIVDRLDLIHDVAKSMPRRANVPETMEGILKAFPPVVHPVVRVHPDTGRKALYVSEREDVRFVGMTAEESRPILDFLNVHAVRYEFVYRHRWEPRDLLVWDNRCLMHQAIVDYDLYRQTRHMWRCALLGPEIGHLLATIDESAA